MTENGPTVERRTVLKAAGSLSGLAVLPVPAVADAQDDPLTCADYERTTLTVNGDPMTFPDDRDNYKQPRGQRVLYDDEKGLYKMWVGWQWGDGFGEGARVWHYESVDGVEWTNAQPTNLDRSGFFDHLRVRSVLKDDGMYKLWFDKYHHSSKCSGWGARVNYATSTDGIAWTDHGRVFDEREQANVVKPSDDRYLMYVETSGDGFCNQRVWGYESSDGQNWSNEQGLTLDGELVWNRDGNPFMQIKYAEVSPDGNRILAYGWRHDDDGGKKLIKAESPVDDGVNFTTSETVIKDLGTEACSNARARDVEGAVRLADDPGTICYVLWNPDAERSFRLCSKRRRIDVEIDVKPCSDPNAVNPDANGVIPVGIKHTDDFDPVERVDVNSLRFGAPDVVENGGASPAHDGHVEDVVPCDGDGADDLVVHFPTEDAGFEGDEATARLQGETSDGTPLFGEDSVEIVGGGGNENGDGRGRGRDGGGGNGAGRGTENGRGKGSGGNGVGGDNENGRGKGSGGNGAGGGNENGRGKSGGDSGQGSGGNDGGEGSGGNGRGASNENGGGNRTGGGNGGGVANGTGENGERGGR